MACQEVKPYKYAYYKPTNTLAGLINNLYSFIVMYKVLNLLGST